MLDFTNQVSNTILETLANADEKTRIEKVKEIFIDYFVSDPDLYILKLPTLMGIIIVIRSISW